MKVSTAAVSHRSVAVTPPGPMGRGGKTWSQSTTVSAGTPISWGARVSCTVIVWMAVAVLPQSSVAVQVRRIV